MPRGITQQPRSPRETRVIRRGHASAIAAIMMAEQKKVPPSGATRSDSKKVISVEPANPPMLKSAWKPDISGLSAARSTSTACTFMATSIEPNDAPNARRASATVVGVAATDRRGR